ncbi:MAG TPA: methylated-DNA--[protein]-cysteine S-methyltransferase [Cytophagales bacterium]|nr:methylated-DNA--[protein]-cysteine S-methyltransferase [Cytophagales bacterium]
MDKQHEYYMKISDAIGFLRKNFKAQPSLDEIAAHVHLSPHHFQRIFQEWAGVSPKKFLQYLSLNYAKNLLKEQQQVSLFDMAHETGLSGTGRLHDLFVNIEGMTPGEYKNGGATLRINYSFAQSLFGEVIIASTPKGICHIAFADDHTDASTYLFGLFPKAEYRLQCDAMQNQVIQLLNHHDQCLQKVKLHLKGTEFQLKVWEALLHIPLGHLKTYASIAQHIGSTKAHRAVGTAIGHNPVALLIPCHRVIQNSGILGGYHWGSDRKAAIIGWEAARV